MAAWILERTAPAARRALGGDKPLARDFYRTIAAGARRPPRRGWQRLTDVAALAPGDVFAWLKPEMFKQRANTGHVGFAVGKPWRHPKFAGVWLVRIADATRELHGDDSRPPGGEGGFGTATIAFLVDAAGTPRAYGWYGEAQDPATYVPTEIALGRVFRARAFGGGRLRGLDFALRAGLAAPSAFTSNDAVSPPAELPPTVTSNLPGSTTNSLRRLPEPERVAPDA